MYLVPFCLISSFLTAVVRGELGELIAYTEESEDKDKEKKEEGEKKEGEGEKKEDKKSQ